MQKDALMKDSNINLILSVLIIEIKNGREKDDEYIYFSYTFNSYIDLVVS